MMMMIMMIRATSRRAYLAQLHAFIITTERCVCYTILLPRKRGMARLMSSPWKLNLVHFTCRSAWHDFLHRRMSLATRTPCPFLGVVVQR